MSTKEKAEMRLKEKAEKRIVAELEPVDVEQLFRDSLDEEGDVKVGCLTFQRSRIVEELDPVAFRCGVNDHVDALVSDGILTEDIGGNHYDGGEAQDIIDEIEEAEEEAAGHE